MFMNLHDLEMSNYLVPSCLDYVFTNEDNFVQDLLHHLQYRTDHLWVKATMLSLTWNIIVHAEELIS